MVTTEWLLDAYFDCRHSKRRTASAVVYEMDYESRLIALRDRINNRTVNNFGKTANGGFLLSLGQVFNRLCSETGVQLPVFRVTTKLIVRSHSLTVNY